MTTNLLDPNNHAPPVAAADMWNDVDELPSLTHEPVGVILPNKRERAVPAPSHTGSIDAPPPGLRINVISAARQSTTTAAVSAAPAVTINEYGGEIVRLEQAQTKGLFQATKAIPAQPLVAVPNTRDLQGEGHDWGRTSPNPLRWLILAGAGVGGVLVAALATQELLLTPKPRAQITCPELVETPPIAQIHGFELDGPCEENARALLATYAKTTSPDAVLPLIRDAPRLTSRLTQDWQPWQVPADWSPNRNATWRVSADGGKSHGCLSGRRPDYTSYQVFFVLEGEALRIDWEATEGLGDSNFSMLTRGRGAGGVIRSYVTPENFYSLVFPETQFRSYKLMAADHEQVVWGYVKLGDSAAAALFKVFESAENDGISATEQAVTLRLTTPPAGAQKNQWLIGEMLHIDWVSP